jgi:hypothetical protein
MACQPGKISVGNGTMANGKGGPLRCDPCNEGMYAPNSASATCWECPFNTYNDVPGAASCLDCPTGKYTGENDRMTYCLDNPTGVPTSAPSSPTMQPSKSADRPEKDPGSSSVNGEGVTDNAVLIGAIVGAFVLLCLALAAYVYLARFHKRVDEENDFSGLSPYEKWMRIEDAKKRGEDVRILLYYCSFPFLVCDVSVSLSLIHLLLPACIL